jgi:hypothetical protein
MLGHVENKLLVHIAQMDDVFWQVQAIIRENPAIASGGTFQDWMAQCYVDSATAGVRRLADPGRDVISLWRVLEGMVSIVPLLTKERFVSLFISLHDAARRADAETSWQDLVGEAGTLSKGLVRAKQSDLKAALQRVVTFAHQNVAHLSVRPTHAETTFHDVRLSIAAAFRLYRWCSGILCARAYSSPVPKHLEPWLRVFRVPWIQPGHGVPKYRSLDEVLAEERNAPSRAPAAALQGSDVGAARVGRRARR